MFIRSHRQDTSYNSPPGCEKYQCKWCGMRAYAQLESPLWEEQAWCNCGFSISHKDTRTCKAHGRYEVLVKTDGEILGECYKCYEEALHAQRRRAGECELCGTKLGVLARWAGRVRCKQGICKARFSGRTTLLHN